MKKHLIILIGVSVLIFGSFFSFAKNGEYRCEEVSEVNTQDYNLNVIPIKQGDQIGVGTQQNLDLSKYKGKIVLLTIFSPLCGWCKYDLSFHSYAQKHIWPEDHVVMVNLSFDTRTVTKEVVLNFIKTGYKQNSYDIDLQRTDFYHLEIDSSEEETDFQAIKKLQSQNKQILFPNLSGTPYSIIIDEKGAIQFRGHFTKGEEEPDVKMNKHYSFISSLVEGSCKVPPSSL